MQILLFTALGFFLLLKHLAGEPTISLDTDWFYRKGGRVVMWFIRKPLANLGKRMEDIFFVTLPNFTLFAVRLWERFDLEVVDGVVNGISNATVAVSSRIRKLQFGDTQGYISLFMMGLGILLIFLVLVRW
jgi:multicomponent Na+:H+ antiporter subunit D